MTDLSPFHLEMQSVYAELEAKLEPLSQTEYETIEQAEHDYALLKTIEREFKSHRKMMIAEYGKKAERAYDKGLRRIQKRQRACEKLIIEEESIKLGLRQKEIARIISEVSPALSPLAQMLSQSAFVHPGWIRPNMSAKLLRIQVEKKAQKAQNDIALLLSTDKPCRAMLIKRYIETMNMDKVIALAEELESIEALLPIEIAPGNATDARPASATLSLHGTTDAMTALLHDIDLLGIEKQTISKAFPIEPAPIPLCPSSFVAVDLETTGSLGMKSGDMPAEITEIGAVKVIDGVIVDEMDILVDPGRHITRASAKLTHITDDMVKGQPGVAEGIAQLDRFSEDLPWVGHDFLNNDMPLIRRTALPVGIAIGHQVFDTFTFAQKNKERLSLPGLSLGVLADHFGIEHDRLHRAVDDARVTALLALKMKEIE